MIVDQRFVLNPLMKGVLRRRQPTFGFGQLGAAVYARTYSRQDQQTGMQERWADTVIRFIEGFGSIRKWWYLTNNIPWDEDYWQQYAMKMADAAFEMRWLPPGRGIQMGGSEYVYEVGAMAQQNPLTGDTPIATINGNKPIESLVGKTTKFLTTEGWKEGTVRCYGKQPVQEITFAPVYWSEKHWTRSPARIRKTVVATPDHGWPVYGLEEKEHNLRVSQVVLGVTNDTVDETSPDFLNGFRHGLFFADGCEAEQHQETKTSLYSLRLCGKKNALLSFFEDDPFDISYPSTYEGDAHVSLRSALSLKDVPASDASSDYLAGFIKGWIAGDGSQTKTYTTISISSQNANALDWLEDHAIYAGFQVVGRSKDSSIRTNYGKRKVPLGVVRLSTARTAWVVESITPIQTKVPVFCATVPSVGYFALANGLYTGNCGAVDIKTLSKDSEWLMRALLNGVGVGFSTYSFNQHLQRPADRTTRFVVPDDREGWAESLRVLLESYEQGSETVEFDYSLIRPAGSPIRRFGGVASGPESLKEMHEQLRVVLDQYVRHEINSTRLVTDVQNIIGTCVVAGGVRRTAEIALGQPRDGEFRRLKDFSRYKDNNLVYQGTSDDRQAWGWTSNNSVQLWDHSDFEILPDIAEQIVVNGEPGLLNMINIQQYGRFGELMPDSATLINPLIPSGCES